MTTDHNETNNNSSNSKAGVTSDILSENLLKLETLSERLVAAISNKRQIDPNLQGPSGELFMKAVAAYMAEMMNNPSKIVEQQVAYWGKSLTHYLEAQNALSEGKLDPPEDKGPQDRRFTDPMWDTHPYFNFIKQQYMMSSDAVSKAVSDMEGLSPSDQKRVDYFSRQIVDMFSPNNFLATNPTALAKAAETEGQSLVDGLENLVNDLEANNGELLVTLADKAAFQVGENLGTSEGAVVYRNRMFELVQYAAQTETVHKVPLIIFPPWINKFYILDLKKKNSLINWLTEQGFSLFVVSWVNPDRSYADVGMDNYVNEGFLEAINTVKKITNEKKVNVVGYCIAGTTLSLALAKMKKLGDKSVNSATFFTTLTDFSDQGEVGVFLDEGFVGGIEREVEQSGVLDALFMSRTFSYLRSNDLIYAPAIRNYMMGEAPPAFDLLYWNGDGTNLPGRMTVEYLRALCQGNHLARGIYEMGGDALSLKDIEVPICAIACETDHIAAWTSSYNGIRQFGSKSKIFILSESGHIAGIVNPPSKKKYGHYTNGALDLGASQWKDGAQFHEGSWWPRWGAWLAERSGEQTKARKLGTKAYPVICAAPGTYVHLS